uniref:Uncharacterized protein n=2 Tax=Physcomitrium patens TaxID=3218 RepID=A0A2K1II51_PHYPA|nr:hypothetical protein PHYPA_027645 [Physcomitrium patens]
MGKPVKEISAPEIPDEELRRIIGVDNIDNGSSVRHVPELPEEKAPIQDLCSPGTIKRENSVVIAVQQETEIHDESEGRALGASIESALESLLGIENDGSECPSGSKDMEKSIVNASSNAEIDGKRDHDQHFERKGLGDSRKNLSEELLSPIEVQKRILRPTITPSPPKREGSQVYNIVRALEGLQVGEKCIHGKVDHGLCHARQGDRKIHITSSTRIQRETSISLNHKVEDAISTPGLKDNLDVTESDGKRAVNDNGSFAPHDIQSGQTTQQTSTTSTEAYTDTVVFQRGDGLLPYSLGKGPLSNFQSSGAIFVQAGVSVSTTPRVRIVHDIPADWCDSESQLGASTSAKAIEGESEVEKILRLQETHDLVCPVCQSCITKSVIVRKRKRTSVISSADKWDTDVQDEEGNVAEQGRDTFEDTFAEEYEDYRCLGCFTFLFRREKSVQRAEVVVPGTAVASAPVSITVSSQTLPSEQSDVRTPEAVLEFSPIITEADYDNRCLPIFFTWRRKTTSPAISEVVAPLLSEEEREAVVKESFYEDLLTRSEDIPVEGLQTSVSEQHPALEVERLPDYEIYALPVAPVAEGEVQIPVLVMESREDRLCFPFLCRKTRTTQVQSEISQTLLNKEDVNTHYEDNQILLEGSEEQTKHRRLLSGDFSDIGDDLWMYQEKVALSVAPQDDPSTAVSRINDSPETSAEPGMFVKAIDSRESEQRADRFCFPPWRSPKTNLEEIEVISPETSQIFDPLNGEESSVVFGTGAESIVGPYRNTSETTESIFSRSKSVENEDSFGNKEESCIRGQQMERNCSDFGEESVDDEDVPLARKPSASKALTMRKGGPLTADEDQQLIASMVVADSRISGELQRGLSFSEDFSELNNLSVASPLDGMHEEIEEEEEEEEGELRRTGTWTFCVPGNCLPSYSELAYQPKSRASEGQTVSESVIEVLGVSGLSLSKEAEPKFHEDVTKDITIHARIETQTITNIISNDPTDEHHGETADSVMVDKSALSRSLEDADEHVASNEWLKDSIRQGDSLEEILPIEVFREIELDSGQHISLPEPAKISEQPLEASTSNQLVLGRDVSLSMDETHSQQSLSVQEVDASYCLPKLRRLWFGSTIEDELLREPLLGRDSEKVRESSCLLDRDSRVDSKDSSARVTIQQTHVVTTTAKAESGEEAERDNLSCTCFLWSDSYGREETHRDTTVTVTTDHTVIEVEGTDATSTLLAATRAAEDAGMMVDSLLQPPQYLKSIVYGGLDVSLTSLGVIAAAAGGDAKTRNVLALGLAYFCFGFIAFFYKIQDLHSVSRTRFRESVGPRFWVNGPLAMLSFLVFGPLPALAFGLSFRQSNGHDYKMAVTVVVSTVALALLGFGKVASKMTKLSYTRTVSTLIITGVVAAVVGFYSGYYISKLLESFGTFD